MRVWKAPPGRIICAVSGSGFVAVRFLGNGGTHLPNGLLIGLRVVVVDFPHEHSESSVLLDDRGNELPGGGETEVWGEVGEENWCWREQGTC